YADLAPKPTGILPVANAEATRPGGLLSRTGMFPKVTPQTAASPGLNQSTAAFPPLTGAQSPLYQKDCEVYKDAQLSKIRWQEYSPEPE
ncbi:MAG TPA: hypothetical protein VK667_04740, partial [Ktedonobacteraceae bacterium]|nr:hypothetical protein [Ktedonobacteraceae bacterium]